jgi:hypothetical protein
MRIEFQHVIAWFAVFCLTHLLNAEDDLWQIVAHLRNLAGEEFRGEALECFYRTLWALIA